MNWDKYNLFLEKYKLPLLIVLMILIIITIISFTIGSSIIQGKQPGIISFIVINFSGYLFFIMMPVEVLIPYYLAEGHSAILLVFVAVTTAIIAHVLNYSVGFLLSEKVIDKFIGAWRYNKAKKAIEKYGDMAVFFFSLLPISSPILMLAAGMVRLKLHRVLLFSFSGLLLKYIGLVLIFSFL